MHDAVPAHPELQRYMFVFDVRHDASGVHFAPLRTIAVNDRFFEPLVAVATEDMAFAPQCYSPDNQIHRNEHAD